LFTRVPQRKAKENDKQIEVERYLCTEAFDAVLKGDGETHDRLLIEAVKEMAQRNEVLVLAWFQWPDWHQALRTYRCLS
jgi:hypothetical protein